MAVPFIPEFDFKHSPTLWNVWNDNNPVRIILGPVGSGKTTFWCFEIMRRACEQEPSPDGYRRFKAAWVRNTMPELKRTTIQTWLSVFPEQACGPLRNTTPVRHHIKLPPVNWREHLPHDHPDQGEPGLDLLVEFMALDVPKDVRELLSYEGTMIIFNEVREIPKAIIDAADLRVGRYPSMQQGKVEPTWFGIGADTNPPDEDHWLYATEHGLDIHGDFIGVPDGWSIYRQPPGVIELKKKGKKWVSDDPEFIGFTVAEELVFAAASRNWAVNPEAENLANLPVQKALDPTKNKLGRGGYYARGLQNKAFDYITSYLQGRYSYVQEGKPVISEFMSTIHVVDDLPLPQDKLLDLGLDIGGNTLNPAATIGYKGPRGLWLILGELIASDMGLDRFSDELIAYFNITFPGCTMRAAHCDPAGAVRDGIFEQVAFDHLITKGFPVVPAPTNNIAVRIDATKAPFNRMVDGKPGILIHRRCSRLIKGLSGAWAFRKLQVSGSEKYSEKPDKNHPYSDICESMGYLLSSGGETINTARGVGLDPKVITNPIAAKTDFDVFKS